MTYCFRYVNSTPGSSVQQAQRRKATSFTERSPAEREELTIAKQDLRARGEMVKHLSKMIKSQEIILKNKDDVIIGLQSALDSANDALSLQDDKVNNLEGQIQTLKQEKVSIYIQVFKSGSSAHLVWIAAIFGLIGDLCSIAYFICIVHYTFLYIFCSPNWRALWPSVTVKIGSSSSSNNNNSSNRITPPATKKIK